MLNNDINGGTDQALTNVEQVIINKINSKKSLINNGKNKFTGEVLNHLAEKMISMLTDEGQFMINEQKSKKTNGKNDENKMNKKINKSKDTDNKKKRDENKMNKKKNKKKNLRKPMIKTTYNNILDLMMN